MELRFESVMGTQLGAVMLKTKIVAAMLCISSFYVFGQTVYDNKSLLDTNTNTTNTTTSVITSTNNGNTTSTNTNINQSSVVQESTNKNDTVQKIIQPPPTAVAPSMMSGGNPDLCATGTGGAMQTQVLGLSSGSTVRDLNCERLKLSKTLFDMGMKVAAVTLLCQDRRVFDAMWEAGTPCPYDGKIGDQAKVLWTNNPHQKPVLNKDTQNEKTSNSPGLFTRIMGWLF